MVSSLSIAFIVFACIFSGALFGMFLGMRVPGHHLTNETKDTVKLGAGLVATMSALVLGLLVGSAKTSFDGVTKGLVETSAKTVLLDRILANYGPDSADIRVMVRKSVEAVIKNVWPTETTGKVHIESVENSLGMEIIEGKIRGLSPSTDSQRILQTQAIKLSGEVAQSRWILIEQRHQSIPTAFLAFLGFWLAMLFTSFGLFAPRNATVVVVLCISAASISGALFIILEMNSPLEGLIRVSSEPLVKALAHLGK
jgi:hypothetical protein